MIKDMFYASYVNNVKPITADEFVNRVIKSINVLSNAVGGVIIPLAGLGLLISLGLFIAGSVFKSESMRKAGTGGLGACLLGILLYFAIPAIIGLLQTISIIMKG